MSGEDSDSEPGVEILDDNSEDYESINADILNRVFEMMKARGHENFFLFNEEKAKFYRAEELEDEEGCTVFYYKKSDDSYLMVYIIKHSEILKKKGETIKKDSLQSLIDLANDHNILSRISEILIVNPLKTLVPATALGGTRGILFLMKNKKIVIYQAEDIHPPNQRFQPIFHKLSQEEVKKLNVELDGEIRKLPSMLVDDPVAKYYDWTPGSVIKITSTKAISNSYTDRSINYRIVVNQSIKNIIGKAKETENNDEN